MFHYTVSSNRFNSSQRKSYSVGLHVTLAREELRNMTMGVDCYNCLVEITLFSQ